MIEVSEAERAILHEKLMAHWAQKQRDAKRGIGGPGLDLTESELMALLRFTRARASS